MNKVTNEVIEENFTEELSSSDLENANGGVKAPIPILIQPGVPTTPIDSI
jgi:hypothetical protein